MSDDSEFSGTPPSRIARSAAPVREQIEEILRTRIRTGELHPGDRLVERDLCEELHVSRTSVREALRYLESRGMVQNIPQKGVIVATMTPEESNEIFQVRGVVGSLAGRLFAERAGKKERAALRQALVDFESALALLDFPLLAVTKDRFSTALVTGAANSAVVNLLAPLKDRLAWLRFQTLAQPGRATQVRVELGHILEAVMAGDGEEAARAVVEHSQATALAAAELLRRRESRF